MKRFWDQASLGPAEDGGHAILLDGRPMRLPGGAVLRVAPRPLAEAIAAEWQAAGGGRDGEMSFADTPLTRLAGTAQERIAPDPGPTIAAIAAYGENELLCYRADHPPALVEAQHRAWQPWLDWAALRHDAVLRVTVGVMHAAQDPQALAALRAAVARADTHRLAGLGLAVPAMGSLVLGLALSEQAISADDAHAAAALDELFQARQWGEDNEAAARRARVAADIALAARYMSLAGPAEECAP